jgi:hypothetical protein
VKDRLPARASRAAQREAISAQEFLRANAHVGNVGLRPPLMFAAASAALRVAVRPE